MEKTVNQIALGGDKYKNWVKSGLKKELEGISNLIAYGFFVYPQLGNAAGSCLSNHFLNPKYEGTLIELYIREIDESFLSKTKLQSCKNENKIIELFSENIGSNCAIFFMPLKNQFDVPIGAIWSICSPENEVKTIKSLNTYSLNLTALVYGQKMQVAMESLAKPFMIFGVSSKTLASENTSDILRAMTASASIVWVVDERKNRLIRFASAGSIDESFSVEIPLGSGIAGACAIRNESFVIQKLQDPDYLKRKFGISRIFNKNIVRALEWKSAMFVPLDAGDRVYGVASVYGQREYGFSSFELEIFSAFAQRLVVGMLLTEREAEQKKIEKKLHMDAYAYMAGFEAIKTAHDADNNLWRAQDRISTITNLTQDEPNSKVHLASLAAGGYVDHAHIVLKQLVAASKKRVRLKSEQRNVYDYLEQIICKFKTDDDLKKIAINIIKGENRDLSFRIDDSELRRAISNILENAIYFLKSDTKPGNKIIEVSFYSENTSNDIIIEIKDNGPGIEEDKLTDIYSYFVTTKGDRGLGFGLAISKSIIEEHGGTLDCSSIWGSQTIFYLKLPNDNRIRK